MDLESYSLHIVLLKLREQHAGDRCCKKVLLGNDMQNRCSFFIELPSTCYVELIVKYMTVIVQL